MGEILLLEDIKDIDHLIESKLLLEFRFKELIRQTARISKNRSRNCVYRAKRSDLRALKWEFHVNCDEDYSSGEGWDVSLQLDPTKMRPQDINNIDYWHVKCRCTCPAWTYWGPDVLGKRNTYLLPPGTSNNQLPKRNLRFKDGTHWSASLVCKHILNTADRLGGMWRANKTRITRRLTELIGGRERPTTRGMRKPEPGEKTPEEPEGGEET